jgi:glycosyltransferase involved in cell wall biosynthesis
MNSSPTPAARLRRIRVLLVSDEMETGGTQRQIVHIARNLDRERFEPAVAYFRNRSFLVDELERAGIAVHHVAKHRRIDVGFLIHLHALLRRERFDVIHCFSFTGELWGALAHSLMPASRRPVLITSVRNTYDWYANWQWRLKRWASDKSCVVLANSHTGADHARKSMNLGRERIEVVYNGVAPPAGPIDPDECFRIRKCLGVEDYTVLGIFVGRLVVQKNVPVLLRALRRIKPTVSAFHMLVVGDGPLRDQLAAMVKELELTEILTFLGHRADPERVIAASDFLVLPSLREGLSNAILEAMMAGKPVVASRVGGNGELVRDQQSGLLFDSDDDASLARCIQTMISDESRRRKYGVSGQERAIRDFSVPVMVRQMEEHYERCVQSCP